MFEKREAQIKLKAQEAASEPLDPKALETLNLVPDSQVGDNPSDMCDKVRVKAFLNELRREPPRNHADMDERIESFLASLD